MRGDSHLLEVLLKAFGGKKGVLRQEGATPSRRSQCSAVNKFRKTHRRDAEDAEETQRIQVGTLLSMFKSLTLGKWEGKLPFAFDRLSCFRHLRRQISNPSSLTRFSWNALAFIYFVLVS